MHGQENFAKFLAISEVGPPDFYDEDDCRWEDSSKGIITGAVGGGGML